MGQYRKHSTSKFARVQHKKREKKRKKQFGGLAAFAYTSDVGMSVKMLARRGGRFH